MLADYFELSRFLYSFRECMYILFNLKGNKVADYFEMGRKAFISGKSSAPAQSKEFMDSIKNDKSHLSEKMTAFSKGWHTANLDAPVPGWTDEENEALKKARNS